MGNFLIIAIAYVPTFIFKGIFLIPMPREPPKEMLGTVDSRQKAKKDIRLLSYITFIKKYNPTEKQKLKSIGVYH